MKLKFILGIIPLGLLIGYGLSPEPAPKLSRGASQGAKISRPESPSRLNALWAKAIKGWQAVPGLGSRVGFDLQPVSDSADPAQESSPRPRNLSEDLIKRAQVKELKLSDLGLDPQIFGPSLAPAQALSPRAGAKSASTGTAQGGSESSAGGGSGGGAADSPGAFKLKLVSFQPGLTSLGEPIMRDPIDLTAVMKRIYGPPNFSFAASGDQAESLLSLGNGGILILEVEDGYLVDGEGPDLIVYENPFVSQDGTIFAETAILSIAEENVPHAYKEFPCQYWTAPYRGCIGVFPVRYAPQIPLRQTGGDAFDLADVGLTRAKFIRIEDTGDNPSLFPSKDGADIDAVALIHTSSQ